MRGQLKIGLAMPQSDSMARRNPLMNDKRNNDRRQLEVSHRPNKKPRDSRAKGAKEAIREWT